MPLWLTMLMLAGAEPGGAIRSDAESRAAETAAAVKVSRSGEWLIQESANFYVCSRVGEEPTGELAARCERLRHELQQTWFGADSPFVRTWEPRCRVVVWRSIDEYRRALGNDRDSSVACATVRVDQGHVVSRQIDLRADAADWQRSGLPHELTHVVLADRFPDEPLPRWADEGMAVLAEPAPQQASRRAALRKAQTAGTLYSVPQLLQLASYPPPHRRDAFYGQSALLVRVLVNRRGTAPFLEFLDAAQRQGCEAALAGVYGLEGLTALERCCTAALSAEMSSAASDGSLRTRGTVPQTAGRQTAALLPE